MFPVAFVDSFQKREGYFVAFLLLPPFDSPPACPSFARTRARTPNPLSGIKRVALSVLRHSSLLPPPSSPFPPPGLAIISLQQRPRTTRYTALLNSEDSTVGRSGSRSVDQGKNKSAALYSSSIVRPASSAAGSDCLRHLQSNEARPRWVRNTLQPRAVIYSKNHTRAKFNALGNI